MNVVCPKYEAFEWTMNEIPEYNKTLRENQVRARGPST